MKIGILTQPLHSNYGGLLQAWALQKILTELGHKSTIINRVWGKTTIPLWRKVISRIKKEIYIGVGKQKRYITVTEDLRSYSEKNIIPFRQNRYYGISPELKSNNDFNDYISNNIFDAYIVGSDQVWRPKYSPNLMTYFLDFIKDNRKVRKIAYAASFGVDNWELTAEETKEASHLLSLFDIITVRESSGIDLVRKYLGCNATQVLDPTLLLKKMDYIELINKSSLPLHPSQGNLFCYVLDKSETVNEAIRSCASSTGYIPFYCNYKTPVSELEDIKQQSDCIVPPVEQWLRSFHDANMIVTDSFHGVIFSIIFNKPFWVIGNHGRGLARFSSLLCLFNLSERMVTDVSDIKWQLPIDWEVINERHQELKTNSLNLLSSALN